MSGFDPQRIFASLAHNDVGYVTVGAIALIAHGVVRATTDVDLIPDPEPANLERLVPALAALDAEPYGDPETPVDLDLLSRDANMRFTTAAGQVDLLCAEQYRRRYPELAQRALTIDLDGTPIVVAAREDLILLKAGSGRERDLLDIGDLLALNDG